MSVWSLRFPGLILASTWLAIGCNGAKKIDVGGTCILNSDCNGSLVCTMGKCHDACHTSADCPTGQSCVNTNDATVCQLPAEGECSAVLPCGGTLVCASDQHCRTPCQSRTDCTTEQICVSGVCAAPAELAPNNQLPQSGPGSAADGGTNACQVGPGGYCWSTYTDPGATATWVTPPTTSAVHLFAQSASDGAASMNATLGGGAVIDLSQYDQMWFDADIPVGTMFSVGIGKAIAPSDSCSWDLTGAGSTRYTVDLRAAKYCNQTACGFDRSQVRSIAWGTGGFGTDFRLDMTLTALGFSRVYSVSQPLTTAGGASLGLNGWCWSLFSWGAASGIGATASWVTPPTANQVEVSLTDTSITSQSGTAVELPSNLQDLSAASYIDIDASVLVAGATSFEVALHDMNTAYWTYTVAAAAGAHTYSIPIENPTYSGTARGHTFDRKSVYLLGVETLWVYQETADITITRIAIRGAGAGGKDAGTSDVANPPAGPGSYRGALVGTGKIGTVEITVLEASSGPLPASGTVNFGGSVVSLSGTLDLSSASLSLSSTDGHQLTGSWRPNYMFGSYQGPQDAGSFALFLESADSTPIRLFCGSYVDTSSSSTPPSTPFAVTATSAGFAMCVGPAFTWFGALDATNTLSCDSGTGLFYGNVNADSGNQWSTGTGEQGTWTVAPCGGGSAAGDGGTTH